MSELSYEVWTTEDGLLWGAFIYGHHDLSLFESEPVIGRLIAQMQISAMIDYEEAKEYLADGKPAQMWIYDRHESEETGDPDDAWYYCDAGKPGALAITGWRFI